MYHKRKKKSYRHTSWWMPLLHIANPKHSTNNWSVSTCPNLMISKCYQHPLSLNTTWYELGCINLCWSSQQHRSCLSTYVYCLPFIHFYLQVSTDPARSVPVDKPEGYNPDDWELLRREVAASDGQVTLGCGSVPNGKVFSGARFPFLVLFNWLRYRYVVDTHCPCIFTSFLLV